MNFNQPSQANSKPSFKVIKIIHLALLAGQCLFAVVTIFLNNTRNGFDTSKDKEFLLIAIVLTVGGFFVGNLLYKQVSGVSAKKATFAEKFTTYQSALIIRYALLEGPSLFCIVCYFLTANLIFLLISGAIIIYFITLKPKADTIAEDLNLSYEEKAGLEDS
ncbi:hypothetical protein ACFQZI_10925 [Mucilaginibacter lutimaris]|uniref:MFS transporter n=1 Tax=Mucilaginibacter lutimaris TaxID=931629 RepID=A0ABW2ZGP7_9SPHI